MGCHNSPAVKPAMEAMEYLFSTVRALPKGVIWQALFGGRYWLPLAATAIMLGADVIRVGMEDSVYLFPHSTEPLKGNGPIIDAVATIARALGRQIATPSEARDILGIPQLSS
jgi:3-keto-5-aminohexanoate cleavage enzyme